MAPTTKFTNKYIIYSFHPSVVIVKSCSSCRRLKCCRFKCMCCEYGAIESSIFESSCTSPTKRVWRMNILMTTALIEKNWIKFQWPLLGFSATAEQHAVNRDVITIYLLSFFLFSTICFQIFSQARENDVSWNDVRFRQSNLFFENDEAWGPVALMGSES